MSSLLSAADVQDRLDRLTGWRLHGQAIEKEFTFRDFPEAVAFVSALVAPAEAADHHPDLEIHYRRVRVRFSTHSAGGLTALDFSGAIEADAAADRLVPRAPASE